MPTVTTDGPAITLTEHEAKQLLQGRGLTIPLNAECPIAEAGADASRIGFPAIVKISAAHIAHKTEAGGVALNLHTAEQVQAAADAMAHLGPTVLVEAMVKDVVAELIIGVIRDPQFGLALVVVAGGVLTELLKDSITLLLPTSREEILRALPRLKVWKLVEGFRGKSGDVHATIAAIEAIARFAQSYHATLDELDVNPLMVRAHDAIVVDALIRMKAPQ